MSTNESPLIRAWHAIENETASGTFRRRVSTLLPVYVTLTNPHALPGLVVEVDSLDELDLGDVRGSDRIRLAKRSVSPPQLALEATERDHTDIFLTVAEDIAGHLVDCADERAAAATLVQRFATWQRFLRRESGSILSSSAQLGLFGELTTLRDLLAPAVGYRDAIEAWTGPDRVAQDFQLGRIAIEVKAVIHSEPQVFKIDGERQLDDLGLDALVLAHHRIVRHRGAGSTLPALIDEVRSEIGSDIIAQDRFTDGLNTYGFHDEDRTEYSAIGYTLRETVHYRVHRGFPRITEADLPPGTGAVRYAVTAGACEQYRIEDAQVSGWLAEPTPLADGGIAPESAVVEYKSTAWTPTGETRSPEHRQKVVKDLQTAIVKTIVAFLNTDGGELVIGLDDDQAVVGLEPDLSERGLAIGDLDAFELQLTTLLRNQIDPLVTQQARIRFEAHNDKHTCHVTVAPSPNPRFGVPLATSNEPARPTFWVRTGNATNSLGDRDLIDYVLSHWH